MNRMKKIRFNWGFNIGLLFMMSFATSASAELWSTTEIHYQYGTGFEAGSAEHHPDGPETEKHIITFQHAGGWEYGSNFFFIDVINNTEGSGDTGGGCRFSSQGGCSGVDMYGEWYPKVSLSKLSGSNLSFGLVKDVLLLGGINFGDNINTLSYIGGLEFSLDLPGFAFANLDVGAFFPNEEGADLDTTYYADFSWLYPFSIGNQDFTIQGHIEAIGPQGGTFFTRKPWILAQPQLRWDIGKALIGKPKKVFVGIEYQYWHNRAGREGKTESFAQALAVWQF